MYEIIKKPLVTEKNTSHGENGVYAFEIDKAANKTQVRTAVENLFDVKVDSVRTMICRNRPRRTGKNLSRIRYWKKALVKVKPGEKIGIFEGV